MEHIETAKLFKNGNSQAVRLPMEFRFEGSEVLIYREGNKVILQAIEMVTGISFSLIKRLYLLILCEIVVIAYLKKESYFNVYAG